MGNFLKNYKMKIHALSPIFIGCGEKIGKKEYIYLPWDHKVIVPFIEKVYYSLAKKGKGSAYLEYMLKNTKDDMGIWLKQQGIQREEYERWMRYELDAGDIPLTGAGFRNADARKIACFIKDPYGMPYVPGSSIKGMIRTALLSWEISQNNEKYAVLKEDIRRKSGEQAKRNVFLDKETRELEAKAFHGYRSRESEKKTRLADAVNSKLSGLIVSDSQPIPMDRLTLSQKIDYSLDGREKALPILRETLAPGTDIYFEISIDTSWCPYSIEDILTALAFFQKKCYENFYSRFKRGSKSEDIVWLGGGAGFVSKTILYPIFDREAVRITNSVFKNTLPSKTYDMHNHSRDISLGIAPHVCKCTRYRGQLYDMGMGRIEWLK